MRRNETEDSTRTGWRGRDGVRDPRSRVEVSGDGSSDQEGRFGYGHQWTGRTPDSW